MKKKGFTLIELLVVIAIIFTLAALVIFSLSRARGGARDSKRVSNLDAIRGALEMYRDANGVYPETGGQWILSDGSCEPVACGSTAEVNNWSNLVDKIETNNFLTVMPNEPILGKTYQEDADTKKYVYYYTATNSNYKMMARLEENPEVMQNDGGSLANFYEVYSIGAISWADCPPVTEEKLLISEVYYDVAPDKGPYGYTIPGSNDGSEYAYEWIELYNPTDRSIGLNGWTIEGSGPYSTTITTPNAEIAPYQFKIVLWTSLIMIWGIGSEESVLQQSLLYMPNNAGWLRLKNQSGTTIDTMSWGNDYYSKQIFDPFLADVPEGHSLARGPAACIDTDTANDFHDNPSPNPGS